MNTDKLCKLDINNIPKDAIDSIRENAKHHRDIVYGALKKSTTTLVIAIIAFAISLMLLFIMGIDTDSVLIKSFILLTFGLLVMIIFVGEICIDNVMMIKSYENIINSNYEVYCGEMSAVETYSNGCYKLIIDGCTLKINEYKQPYLKIEQEYLKNEQYAIFINKNKVLKILRLKELNIK